MRLDSDLAARLDFLPKLDMADVAAARAEFARIIEVRRANFSDEWAPGVSVREATVPGADPGADVPVQIVTPHGGRTRGALVYLHGGGFTIGTAESTLPACALLAREADLVVVTVDYRLAPEHPYPAALHDTYAVLEWIFEHSGDLGVDRWHIGLGGASAGGTLAVATALLARDQDGPPPAYLFLEFPGLDYRLAGWSAQHITDAPLLTPDMMRTSRAMYYRGDRDAIPVYAAPDTADDLGGLPPTYMLACEYDPLRDGNIEFAMRLMRAGVSVELHMFAGTFHGFLSLAAGVSQRAMLVAAAALRAALSPEPPR